MGRSVRVAAAGRAAAATIPGSALGRHAYGGRRLHAAAADDVGTDGTDGDRHAAAGWHR